MPASAIKLMRIKHWSKNAGVLFALFFAGRFYFCEIALAFAGVAVFCLISSAVYILNDIMDAPADRLHSIKKNRPIASGALSVRFGCIQLAALLAVALSINFWLFDGPGAILPLVYLLLNVGYSIKFKHVPILDVMIIAGGFLIRMYYGAFIIDVPISGWLYLTTLSMALYMSLGKRRNELLRYTGDAAEVRKVLGFYNAGFLDKNMHIFLTATIVFYALWAAYMSGAFILSVPVVIFIAMRYSLLAETSEFADPVDILLGDKLLLGLLFIYGIGMGFLIVF